MCENFLADLFRPDWHGAAPTRVGGAWLFLPPAPGDLPAKTVEALATYVYQRRESLLALMRMPGDPLLLLRATPDLLDHCPVNEAELAKLLSINQFAQVLNDLCHMTAQVDHTSPTLDFIRAAVCPQQNNVVLDVGCSAGRHLWMISSLLPGRHVGLDLDLLAMLAGDCAWQTARTVSPHWVRASVLDLPFASGVFTTAITAVTLSEVAIRPALAELARVLKPGGQVVLTVEGPGFWRQTWDRSRPWSRTRVHLLRWWLGNKLTEAGLDWQSYRLTRRLAGVSQFHPETLTRLVRRAGFKIDECKPLTHYGNAPSLIGLSAVKVAG